jgi:hypothetical protein
LGLRHGSDGQNVSHRERFVVTSCFCVSVFPHFHVYTGFVFALQSLCVSALLLLGVDGGEEKKVVQLFAPFSGAQDASMLPIFFAFTLSNSAIPASAFPRFRVSAFSRQSLPSFDVSAIPCFYTMAHIRVSVLSLRFHAKHFNSSALLHFVASTLPRFSVSSHSNFRTSTLPRFCNSKCEVEQAPARPARVNSA